MNRRVAILIGSIIAAIAAAEIVVLSGLLAAERRGDRDRYHDAMTRQRRAAGRVTQAARPAPSSKPQTFCVRGVDTFATTTRKTLQKELLDGKRRLDPVALAEVSDLAIRAERYVETANAGPALPQRLGRTRVKPSDPPDASPPAAPEARRKGKSRSTADERKAPRWQPLKPPQIECEDRNAYAAFRLEIPAPPVAPPEPGNTTVPGKQKTPRRQR